jgi:hypothetical protein
MYDCYIAILFWFQDTTCFRVPYQYGQPEKRKQQTENTQTTK